MEHLSIGPREEHSPLLNLPDELLLQILSLCEPASLLQLSRCSRSLRDILLATSGEDIWTTSRLNYAPIKCRKTQMFPFGVSFTNEVEVPLPDRFDGITEPAFARLMFEGGCSTCRSGRGKAYTALQRRICDTCKDAHCVKRSRLLEVIQPFADTYHYTDEDANAWLASVRLHCSKQQAILEEDLYWREEVQEHSKRAVQGGRVTKLTLDADETAASKKRDQFERQWREWLEASRVVNEGNADPRLAGSTAYNSFV